MQYFAVKTLKILNNDLTLRGWHEEVVMLTADYRGVTGS